MNHHDFLDGSFLTKLKEQQSRRTFFSQVGTQSLDRGGRTPNEDFKEADVELGRHRLMRSKVNYLRMQQQSYEIPLNKEKAGVPRWLQQKLKQEGKNLAPRVYQAAKDKQMKLQQSQAQLEQKPKPAFQRRKKQEPEVDRNYCERHIFVLADDQDLLADDLKFTYVEINHRLAKFVSDNVWRSQAAQRLSLNEKIKLGKPS